MNNRTENQFVTIPRHKYAFASALFFLLLTFFSCEKENNASVLITVSGGGERIEQAMVYLKENAISNPRIPLEQYDQFKVCDAIGEAYFNQLKPGSYFFFITGYSQKEHKQLSGEVSLEITENDRHNHFEVDAVLQ